MEIIYSNFFIILSISLFINHFTLYIYNFFILNYFTFKYDILKFRLDDITKYENIIIFAFDLIIKIYYLN